MFPIISMGLCLLSVVAMASSPSGGLPPNRAFSERADVLNLRAEANTIFNRVDLEPMWKAQADSIALILGLYKNETVYFLSRDMDYTYDAMRVYLNSNDPGQLSRFRSLNVSSLSKLSPNLIAYLQQEGLGNGKAVLIDSGFEGSIIDKIKQVLPQAQIKGHLWASRSDIYPSTFSALQHFNPLAVEMNAPLLHGAIMEYENMVKAQHRAIDYTVHPTTGKWTPVVMTTRLLDDGDAAIVSRALATKAQESIAFYMQSQGNTRVKQKLPIWQELERLRASGDTAALTQKLTEHALVKSERVYARDFISVASRNLENFPLSQTTQEQILRMTMSKNTASAYPGAGIYEATINNPLPSVQAYIKNNQWQHIANMLDMFKAVPQESLLSNAESATFRVLLQVLGTQSEDSALVERLMRAAIDSSPHWMRLQIAGIFLAARPDLNAARYAGVLQDLVRLGDFGWVQGDPGINNAIIENFIEPMRDPVASYQALRTIIENYGNSAATQGYISDLLSRPEYKDVFLRGQLVAANEILDPAVRARLAAALPEGPSETLKTERRGLVRAMLNTGPNVWVPTGNQPVGDKIFQRGLSGSRFTGDRLNDGSLDFEAILNGGKDSTQRSISIFGTYDKSSLAMVDVNQIYSNPISIRGKIEGDSSRLQRGFGDEHAYLRGLAFADISEAGLFFNEGEAAVWARNYLNFVYRSMNDPEIAFEFREGRGLQFFNEVAGIMSSATYGDVDIEGRPILKNGPEINRLLLELGSRYSTADHPLGTPPHVNPDIYFDSMEAVNELGVKELSNIHQNFRTAAYMEVFIRMNSVKTDIFIYEPRGVPNILGGLQSIRESSAVTTLVQHGVDPVGSQFYSSFIDGQLYYGHSASLANAQSALFYYGSRPITDVQLGYLFGQSGIKIDRITISNLPGDGKAAAAMGALKNAGFNAFRSLTALDFAINALEPALALIDKRLDDQTIYYEDIAKAFYQTTTSTLRDAGVLGGLSLIFEAAGAGAAFNTGMVASLPLAGAAAFYRGAMLVSPVFHKFDEKYFNGNINEYLQEEALNLSEIDENNWWYKAVQNSILPTGMANPIWLIANTINLGDYLNDFFREDPSVNMELLSNPNNEFQRQLAYASQVNSIPADFGFQMTNSWLDADNLIKKFTPPPEALPISELIHLNNAAVATNQRYFNNKNHITLPGGTGVDAAPEVLKNFTTPDWVKGGYIPFFEYGNVAYRRKPNILDSLLTSSNWQRLGAVVNGQGVNVDSEWIEDEEFEEIWENAGPLETDPNEYNVNIFDVDSLFPEIPLPN